VQSASLTEWADNSAGEVANTAHVASGAVTYSDADAGDVHTATYTARGTGYLGTFSLSTGQIDSNDSIGWSFSVSDSAMNYLAAGQTLTQLYDVTVDDGHGGAATQTVTITLVGSADATTTKGKPGGSHKGGKGAGADVADDGAGPHGTSPAGHSLSDIVRMFDDQAPAPADHHVDAPIEDNVITILGNVVHQTDFFHV
jgi:VCBS repeat-containing protein